MRRLTPALLLPLLLGGCAANGPPPPSLQPRAGENVDPRVPVNRPMNDRPASPALVARLGTLVGQARAGESAFATAIEAAERAAASAGSPQSESWIAAQEALSAAVAAHGPAANAMGAIDSLGAQMLSEQGGMAPNDQKAIDEAAAAVGAIAERQTARLDSVKTQLGL
jgi:hypothetical protein